MSRSRRRQYITDQAVQGTLLFRTILYWFLCLLTILLCSLGWSLLTAPPRPFPVLVRESTTSCGPAVLGSLILLPLVLFDVLRLSNRFVAPVQQVRHGLRHLADGRKVQPICLRKDDFWQELAEYFNQCIEQPTRGKLDDAN